MHSAAELYTHIDVYVNIVHMKKKKAEPIVVNEQHRTKMATHPSIAN